MSTLFATPQETQPALFEMQSQIGMTFPQNLVQEFCPKRVEDFIGLERPKRILLALLKRPRSASLLLVGPPGCGKTTISQRFAEQLSATTWEIAAQECTADRLRDLCFHLSFVPKSGLDGFHCVIVSECDAMSDAASKLLLSKLDSSGQMKNVIWLFSANSTEKLEARFVSRNLQLDCSPYGMSVPLTELLTTIWNQKMPGIPVPSFKKIISGNVRDTLMQLECMILEAQF